MSASLISGFYPLLVAGVSVFLTSQLVLSRVHTAVHDRLDMLIAQQLASVDAKPDLEYQPPVLHGHDQGQGQGQEQRPAEQSSHELPLVTQL